jgi:DNA-binding transcriptional MerR regulator/effector-binding domain-containing protein
MKNRLTIGEMSKLHNIPVKTLRYYDDIGLFQPIEIDTGNGYRYYATEQFEQLNTIKYLKFLGFSLKEIDKHLQTRNVDQFLKLLKKQKQITDRTIQRLEIISRQFANRITEIEQSLTIDHLCQPVLKHLPERTVIKFEGKVGSEPEWEMALRQLENMVNGNPSLFIGKVGLTVETANLQRGKFNEYSSVFILWEEAETKAPFVRYLAAGDYASLCYRGNRSQSRPFYERLLQFIRTQKCIVSGDAIERMIIDQYITTDPAVHLTEIQIPVTKEG